MGDPLPLQSQTVWKLGIRWALFAALLLAEVLFLTIRFDTGSLKEESVAWVQFLHNAPAMLRVGLTMAAVVLLLGGVTFWKELWRDGSPVPASYRWRWLLCGHFAAVALFYLFTAVVLEGDLRRTSAAPLAWFCAWFLSGTATMVCWALAALPPAAWARLARCCWPVTVLGSVIGAAAWATGLASERLWVPLAGATFDVVAPLLQLLFPGQVVCDVATKVVGTQTFAVAIAPQCSGYEGMGLMVVVLGSYLWLFRSRLRFPAALLLLPLGTAAVWLLNVGRIVLLVALGTWGWPEVALGGFHSQAGWLAFNGVAFLVIFLAGRLPWIAASSAPVKRSANPTVAYLGPFLAILLVTMICAAFTAGFDWLYPLRVVAAAAVLWLCRRSYQELRGPWSWQAVGWGVLIFGVWVGLNALRAAGPSEWPPALRNAPLAATIAWLAFRVVGHVVTVPLAEELAFRGYLPRRLTRGDFLSVPPGHFSWLGFVVSSVLFGVLHGANWLPGTLAGMAFALAMRRRGQLLDAVVAHATANALLAAYALATGQWNLWS
jgi:exosortase E/protease (VPEID-CTERM system)